ncbi:MAG: ABC transporter permease [Pseudomonadota bacterium]
MKSSSPVFLGGTFIACFILFLGMIGAFWTPYAPQTMDLSHRLSSFSSQHWLGTDHFGRDVLSLMMSGLSYSLFVAVSAVALGGFLGFVLAMIATLWGRGISGQILAAITDFFFVFPALLVAMLLATLYGPSLFNAVVAIAVFNIPIFFRFSRALAQMLLARDHVLAAQALGQTQFGLLRYHLLPNMAGVLITQISIQLAMALLAEASLSYLGLGVPTPLPSLGRMLQDAQTYMSSMPRLALLPGGLIAFAVLGFNLLGDGLRDKLDIRRLQTF